MSKTRIAVIGCGKLGGYHANIAAGLDAFDLVAVVDPAAPARESLAEKTGARPLADVTDVIDHIDAAVVATPTATHAQTVVALCETGKHVLVEKPIAPTTAEADRMVAAAETAGRVLQVGHVERFNPALSAAPTPVGRPKFVRASRSSGYTFRSTDIGVVMDLMVHDIDLVLSLTGSRVVKVTAQGLSVLGGHEDVAAAQLTLADGCVAQLNASRVSPTLVRQMECWGEDGYTAFDFGAGTAKTVRPNSAVLARRFDAAGVAPDERNRLMAGGMFEDILTTTEHTAPKINAIEHELIDFAGAIRTGGAPKVTGAAGRDVVAVAACILDAIERHQWDGVPSGRAGAFAMPMAGEPLRKAG